MALTHPEYGYYMQRDVFGRGGDFTTSPEVSQVFGELVGIWCVASWQQLGSPSRIRLVEVGPGRGTLMSDVLRSAAMFPAFRAALEVHLVEVSPYLRKVQRRKLSSSSPPDADPDIETTLSESKQDVKDDETVKDGEPMLWYAPRGTRTNNSEVDHPEAVLPVEVCWHRSLDEVPQDIPTLVIAHEFLDALPVHQLVRTPRGWRERLVGLRSAQPSDDVASDGASPQSPAAGGQAAVPWRPGATSEEERDLDQDARELDFFLSRSATPASTVFTRHLSPELEQAEVCPDAQAFVQALARRLVNTRGAALLIDYGQDSAPGDSLRGIKNHRFVHPLHAPGEIDLSADVDFDALRRVACAEAPELRCPPLQLQRDFLAAMGLEARVNVLLKRAKTAEEQRALIAAAQRLVQTPGMGSAYKVFALASSDIPRDGLAGFPSA